MFLLSDWSRAAIREVDLLFSDGQQVALGAGSSPVYANWRQKGGRAEGPIILAEMEAARFVHGITVVIVQISLAMVFPCFHSCSKHC